jgi:regulator of protease activity HflC (stomatin/prohibitin superfamily)
MRWSPVLSPDSPDAGGEPPPSPALQTPAAPRRAGSMTLREGVQGPGDSPLDPANQSLADALRVMMRLLQVAMIILAVLYLFSGMHRVKEGERGIQLLFGNIVGADLEPGLHWSAPFPMGEVVRVDTQRHDIDISKDFWIYIAPGSDPSPEKQSPTASLKPDQGGSGSVITGDGNIAHTKWKVGYERRDSSNYAKHVLPGDQEEQMVLAAVKRGVVQATAQVTVDDLLRQNVVNGTTVPLMAWKVAQESLDRLNSGLTITSLTMDPPIPPLNVRTAFNNASAAAANANKNIQEAQTYRSQQLNQAAGNAARYLVYYIDEYEHALAKNDQKAADATLATINGLLDGKPTEVLRLDENGAPAVEETNKPTGQRITFEGQTTGDVASTLNEARLYKSGVVSRARSDASRFAAKLEQYNANPRLMVQREWGDAMKAFMARENVTLMLMPPGINTLNLILNQDPDDAKRVETFMKEQERLRLEKKRLEELQRPTPTTTPNTLSS